MTDETCTSSAVAIVFILLINLCYNVSRGSFLLFQIRFSSRRKKCDTHTESDEWQSGVAAPDSRPQRTFEEIEITTRHSLPAIPSCACGMMNHAFQYIYHFTINNKHISNFVHLDESQCQMWTLDDTLANWRNRKYFGWTDSDRKKRRFLVEPTKFAHRELIATTRYIPQ